MNPAGFPFFPLWFDLVRGLIRDELCLNHHHFSVKKGKTLGQLARQSGGIFNPLGLMNYIPLPPRFHHGLSGIEDVRAY